MRCVKDSESSDSGDLIIVGTEGEAAVSQGTLCSEAEILVNYE